ncbi:MAG: sigma-70 family RNA polymerase sigma factor, partial [Candidatus Peregrinibacteria bacterium]
LLRLVHGLSQLSEPDAEDVIKHVFLKAYEHLNDFDPELKLSTWLMRIARNEVIDLWRRRKVRSQEVWLDETQFGSTHATESTGAADLDKKIKSGRVHALLNLLKPAYREVLYLHYLEDKNYDEIADIIKAPPGTVAALISRGKKAFSELTTRLGISDHFNLPQP